MTVVGNKWKFKVKTNVDGYVDGYKARLVARGFTQLHGFDYDKIFSLVVKLETI